MIVREAPATTPTPRGTLLYLHGLGESGLCFEGLLARSELSSWRHLAPDLPGYGKSPWRAAPLGLAAQAEEVAAWLRGREEPPAVLVGHSMGSVVGLLLAEAHPELVRAFLNVEGNVSFEDCVYSSQAAALSEEAWLAGGYRELLDRLYLRSLGAGETPRGEGEPQAADPPLREYYVSARLADPRTYYLNGRELVEISRREEIAGRLAALPVPQLYLAGLPRGTGEHSRGLLEAAGVPWRGIEPAGHWPFLDQPQAFLAEMLRFLDTL